MIVVLLVLALLLPACAPRERRPPAAWSFVGTPVAAGWWYDLVDVRTARGKGTTGAGVTLATVDTGVLPGHEDLPPARGVATCGRDPSDFTDTRGHGTQMAGIALGRDPGNATRGVAPGAGLVAIKVDCGLVTPGAFARGLDRAIEAGPDVVLLALGGYPPDAARLLEDRVARNRQILFVVASVWDGVAHPLPAWTRRDNAVVVAAMTLEDGKREIPFDARTGDIAAPGRDVETADVAPHPDKPGLRRSYSMQGTSAAAAIVAGCAALVKEGVGKRAARPDGAALKRALLDASVAQPGLRTGRLHCGRAVP
jgi:subtilisin family serine protease